MTYNVFSGTLNPTHFTSLPVHQEHHCTHFLTCLRKGKEEYLYSAILVRTHTLKALRHGSHSFTCKQYHACLSFVSVHHMALPLTEASDIELQLTTHLSTLKG